MENQETTYMFMAQPMRDVDYTITCTNENRDFQVLVEKSDRRRVFLQAEFIEFKPMMQALMEGKFIRNGCSASLVNDDLKKDAFIYIDFLIDYYSNLEHENKEYVNDFRIIKNKYQAHAGVFINRKELQGAIA